jgi:hypothetical protein
VIIAPPKKFISARPAELLDRLERVYVEATPFKVIRIVFAECRSNMVEMAVQVNCREAQRLQKTSTNVSEFASPLTSRVEKPFNIGADDTEKCSNDDRGRRDYTHQDRLVDD